MDDGTREAMKNNNTKEKQRLVTVTTLFSNKNNRSEFP